MLRKRTYPPMLSLLAALILTISTFLPGISGAPAKAAQDSQAETKTATFADLGYKKDETLQGIFVARDFTVRWPDSWDVQPGNTVNLIFSHSLALRSSASMAVDWNGTRLTSVMLDKNNADHAAVNIAIPEELILAGYNKLHIEFYLGIHDYDVCQDIDNPASWAVVHLSSFFTFSYSPKSPALDLSLYPVPLIDNSDMVENQVTYVIPDQPKLTELSAMGAISARLGELAAWRKITTQVVAASQVDAVKPQGDLIVIGAPERTQPLSNNLAVYSAGSFKDLSGGGIPGEDGVVYAAQSPYDPSGVMIFVTGANYDAVLKAGSALSSSATYPRFSGQLGIVKDVPVPSETIASKANKRVYTLEELGYPDMTAMGSREQVIKYVLPLQSVWQNQSEATLDLKFSHSEILDAGRSSLSVLLNSTPVGSIALTKDNATNGTATFHLPARLFVVGDNEISLVANLHLPSSYENQANCLDNSFRESWFVSYSNSVLTLPDTSAGLFISLTDFPDAFIGSPDLSQLAIVVPNLVDMGIASSLVQITESLGHTGEGELLAPKIIDSQMLFDANPPYTHQILLGLPSQNPAINVVNDQLPQPFIANSDQAAPVEAIASISSQTGAAGYIQAATSTQGNPILVITGTSPEGVSWAAGVLNNTVMRSKLKGDIAIVDGPTSIVTAEVKYKSADKFAMQEAAAAAETAEVKGTASWVAWLAGIVLGVTILLLLVGALIQIPRKQKSREYETRSI